MKDFNHVDFIIINSSLRRDIIYWKESLRLSRELNNGTELIIKERLLESAFARKKIILKLRKERLP